MTTPNNKKSSSQAPPSVMLPSSLSRGRVFLSPIPTSTTYNFKAIHKGGGQQQPQQQQQQNNSTSSNTVTVSNAGGNNAKHYDEVEECCLYYYSRVSLTGDEEDENDFDNDTVVTKTTSAILPDKDDFTVFSTSPPRSLDTVMSPTTITSDSGISSTVVTSDSTTATTISGITTTTTTDEKVLPASPPLSPPLSPISSRPRFPRWIKQISAPSIMATPNPSMSTVSSPTNNVFTISPREMVSYSSSLLPLHKKNNNSSSTSLLSKPPSLMRRIMMPPSATQDTKPPPLEISHPSPSAHYYGSVQIREYLHDVMKTNRFDEMLLSGFPALCPQHGKKPLSASSSGNNVDPCGLDDDNDCGSIMTEEDDGDYDESIIHKGTSPCLCNHRQMTIRITLTPGHCRATEAEIYGHSRPSHHQQRKFQRNATFSGKNHRIMISSISTPTPAATRRKHAKDPTPTLSLPPLPRHSSLQQQQQQQQQRTAPLYVVTSSHSAHCIQSQQSTSPTKSSVYYNSYHQQYHHHQQPILILPNGARRHYLQK